MEVIHKIGRRKTAVARVYVAKGKGNITVNKNSVPNDPRSPFITSGLRVGTPAITTRGFTEAETIELTGWMCDVLESLETGNSEQVIAEVKGKVLEAIQSLIT